MYDMIGDFYTTLTTDKRFILLDTAEWDLKDRHKVEIVLDEEDEEETEDEEESQNLSPKQIAIISVCVILSIESFNCACLRR